jgi:hypothetical protein
VLWPQIAPLNSGSAELCVHQKLTEVRQQALHGGVQLLSVLDVKAEPQRVLKALGWLISHSRFLLTTLHLIQPVQKGFTAPFAERGERDIQ